MAMTPRIRAPFHAGLSMLRWRSSRSGPFNIQQRYAVIRLHTNTSQSLWCFLLRGLLQGVVQAQQKHLPPPLQSLLYPPSGIGYNIPPRYIRGPRLPATPIDGLRHQSRFPLGQLSTSKYLRWNEGYISCRHYIATPTTIRT